MAGLTKMRAILVPLALLATTLMSCHRLDTLTVIDNPNGPGVIVDNMYGNDQRVICVLASSTQNCTKWDASVVVSGVTDPADVSVGWSADNHVQINVARGRVSRAATSALSGRVKIEVRT